MVNFSKIFGDFISQIRRLNAGEKIDTIPELFIKQKRFEFKFVLFFTWKTLSIFPDVGTSSHLKTSLTENSGENGKEELSQDIASVQRNVEMNKVGANILQKSTFKETQYENAKYETNRYHHHHSKHHKRHWNMFW